MGEGGGEGGRGGGDGRGGRARSARAGAAPPQLASAGCARTRPCPAAPPAGPTTPSKTGTMWGWRRRCTTARASCLQRGCAGHELGGGRRRRCVTLSTGDPPRCHVLRRWQTRCRLILLPPAQVRTEEELAAALQSAQGEAADRLCVIECIVHRCACRWLWGAAWQGLLGHCEQGDSTSQTACPHPACQGRLLQRAAGVGQPRLGGQQPPAAGQLVAAAASGGGSRGSRSGALACNAVPPAPAAQGWPMHTCMLCTELMHWCDAAGRRPATHHAAPSAARARKADRRLQAFTSACGCGQRCKHCSRLRRASSLV